MQRCAGGRAQCAIGSPRWRCYAQAAGKAAAAADSSKGGYPALGTSMCATRLRRSPS